MTLALLLALLGPAAAQDVLPGSTEASAVASEEEVLAAWRDNRMLTARRLAEELLEQNDRSIVGHFVLAAALRKTSFTSRVSTSRGNVVTRSTHETSGTGTFSLAPPKRPSSSGKTSGMIRVVHVSRGTMFSTAARDRRRLSPLGVSIRLCSLV